MLRRAYLVFASVWALVFLANGATKLDGIGRGDVLLAAAPLLVPWILRAFFAFVIGGAPPAVSRRRP